MNKLFVIEFNDEQIHIDGSDDRKIEQACLKFLTERLENDDWFILPEDHMKYAISCRPRWPRTPTASGWSSYDALLKLAQNAKELYKDAKSAVKAKDAPSARIALENIAAWQACGSQYLYDDVEHFRVQLIDFEEDIKQAEPQPLPWWKRLFWRLAVK